MNCTLARRQLLLSTDPRNPDDELAVHLALCPSCRGYSERLVRIESALPEIPVPPSFGKASLLRLFPPTPVVRPQARFAPLRRLVIGTAAAAAVILAVAVVRDRTGRGTVTEVSPADPLLASVLDRHLILATADDPAERVRALAGLADDLQDQTRRLARVADGNDLAALARMYERVVRDGLMAQAAILAGRDVAERRQLLQPLTAGLVETSRSADGLAGEVPAAAAGPLKQIAAAARDATGALARLAEEQS